MFIDSLLMYINPALPQKKQLVPLWAYSSYSNLLTSICSELLLMMKALTAKFSKKN